jgi:hypothetical protein
MGRSAGHLVQFYGADEQQLRANVCRFVAQSLARGGAAALIGTHEHNAAVLRALGEFGVDPSRSLAQGRIVVLDARQTLSEIMQDGRPDRLGFEAIVGGLLGKLRARADGRDVRAYDEMVGILWQSRDVMAAVRLEHLWNAIRLAVDFDILCGYPIDIFGGDFQRGAVDELLRAHTDVLAGGSHDGLDAALKRAIGDVLGQSAETILPTDGSLPASWAKMPEAEAKILWLRDHLPGEAERLLAKAKEYYSKSAL